MSVDYAWTVSSLPLSVIVVAMRALTSSSFLGLHSRWRRRCALAVALHRCDSGLGISHARKLRTFGLHEIFKCAYLNFMVYGRKPTDIHTHAPRNAVTLVWGLLRLAPITLTFCHDVELKDLSITPVSTLQLVIILQPTITAMVQNIKYFHILQHIAFTFRQPLCTCCKDQNTCNHHLCQLHSCSSCTSAVE